MASLLACKAFQLSFHESSLEELLPLHRKEYHRRDSYCNHQFIKTQWLRFKYRIQKRDIYRCHLEAETIRTRIMKSLNWSRNIMKGFFSSSPLIHLGHISQDVSSPLQRRCLEWMILAPQQFYLSLFDASA